MTTEKEPRAALLMLHAGMPGARMDGPPAMRPCSDTTRPASRQALPARGDNTGEQVREHQGGHRGRPPTLCPLSQGACEGAGLGGETAAKGAQGPQGADGERRAPPRRRWSPAPPLRRPQARVQLTHLEAHMVTAVYLCRAADVAVSAAEA
jgi:hypothetical protein